MKKLSVKMRSVDAYTPKQIEFEMLRAQDDESGHNCLARLRLLI